MKWEPVGDNTDRLQVVGGWLYRVRTDIAPVTSDEFVWAVSIVFVPYPG